MLNRSYLLKYNMLVTTCLSTYNFYTFHTAHSYHWTANTVYWTTRQTCCKLKTMACTTLCVQMWESEEREGEKPSWLCKHFNKSNTCTNNCGLCNQQFKKCKHKPVLHFKSQYIYFWTVNYKKSSTKNTLFFLINLICMSSGR